MPYDVHIRLPGGVCILRMAGKRPKNCPCGVLSTRLCDWKVGAGRTCDAPLCDNCTSSPAPGKDICPTHAAEWKKRQERHT